jgi:signal transduction histidine kinase/CheY-like chemotaxis protein
MKTRSIILYISLISLSLVVLFSFIFNQATQSKNKLLLKNGYVDLKSEANNIYESKSNLSEKCVFDYSFWDDLLTATAKSDTNWINVHFTPSLSNYDINYVWILNKTGAVVYNKNAASKTNVPFIIIDKSNFLNELDKNPFKSFHIKYQGNILQLIVAPIQPSGDLSRVSAQQGYLICGKIYDTIYTQNLSKISSNIQYKIEAITNQIKDSIDGSNNVLNYNKPLFDFWGKQIASISAEKRLDMITTYKTYLRNYSLLYLSILIGLLFWYYQFMRIKILKPIRILSDALNKKDGSHLGYLKARRDEFADIAFLIDDSFEKNKKLEAEIEARLKTEEALKKSAVELERATIDKIRAEQDRIAKAEFLSTMSHEIRTPINGVIGITNLLKTENLTEKQHELVNTLAFSSTHLLSILTDILDLSKIESGNLTFDKVTFNLNDICKSIQTLHSANATAKGIYLNFKSDGNTAEYLSGDSVRLCQILNNLLGNAIKFTEKGGVLLSCALLPNEIENRKQLIEFTIEDSGIGIDNDKLDTIFESFSQADRTITSNYGGTGLGLTITKKLIELQGGTIVVKSTLGVGTIFTFTLSYDLVDTSNYHSEKDAKNFINNNLEGLRILVAEDNKINAIVLNKFLDKWNVKMDLVLNGQEAIEKLESSTYDIILMDLHMPIMDGRAATRFIRNNTQKSYHTIPIIALTADATSETQKSILDCGFNQYVSKPFNPEALYRVLENYKAATY